MEHFQNRCKKVAHELHVQGIAAVLFEDTEGRRSPNIRYLTGQPNDAILIITSQGKSILIAWDINMANLYGTADEIYAYSDFERDPAKALKAILEREGILKGSKVEIPSVTSYPKYISFVEVLSDWDLLCRDDGIDNFVCDLRAIKDSAEIEIYREVSRLTDIVILEVSDNIKNSKIKTEAECALFIEKKARELGCEGLGFEILCAGPDRSFGIHCFPSWTNSLFATDGLSILDFGLKYKGYTSDVTVTFASGSLSTDQKKYLALVEDAYNQAVKACSVNCLARTPALEVEKVFSRENLFMPHSLGHGIGLEAHESPWLRSKVENDGILKPGMIFTIEPGLYDLKIGGVRLENDFLMTETGVEVLTHSKIIYV